MNRCDYKFTDDEMNRSQDKQFYQRNDQAM
jgi:hypothetical protein